MKYVARHYIRLGGEMITPGELICGMDEEKAAWLRRVGAIEPFWNAIQDSAPEADEAAEEDAQEASSEPSAPAPQIDASAGIVRPAKKGRSKA